MKKGVKFTEVATGTTQTFNLPYFNSVLEAKQHFASVITAISEIMVANLNARVETGIMYNALESVVPSYMACAFTGGGYNAGYAATPVYVSAGVASCAIIPNEYFKLYKNGALTLDAATYSVNGELITFNNNNTGSGSGDYKATWMCGINSTQGYLIGVSHNIMCSGYNGAFGTSGAHITSFGNSMLSMACIVPLTDNSVSLQFYQVNTADGFYTGSYYSGFSTIDGIAWVNNRRYFNEQYFTITPPQVELPKLNDEVTDEINTETGASESNDSEDNVGGDGHVTLINNVVNYDNYTPNYSRLNTGFITAYEINDSQLVTLHSFLYSETITDMIKNFFAGDASKAIIDLFNIPVAPNTEATSSVINIGVISSGASANAIQGETVTFDFGSIDITANSYYSNSFMDLSPYNQYSIYLPYIGFRNLSTNDVRSINDNGFKIYLKYVVDVLTGDFVAIVEADHNNCAVDNDTGTVTTAKLTKQLINVYNGSMRTDIPLSYRNPLQGLMPIMSGLASTMFTMATASASGATDMQQLSNSMNTLNNIGNVNNSLMARSDSISGSVGNLSLRTAFIINQECPKYIRTGKSNQFSGYPVYKFLKLNDDRGFVKVRNVIASGFPGTAHEQEMVVSLLKKGVWCK